MGMAKAVDAERDDEEMALVVDGGHSACHSEGGRGCCAGESVIDSAPCLSLRCALRAIVRLLLPQGLIRGL
eukprot:5229498-Prymnesium_polylepis.1